MSQANARPKKIIKQRTDEAGTLITEASDESVCATTMRTGQSEMYVTNGFYSVTLPARLMRRVYRVLEKHYNAREEKRFNDARD